MVSSGGRPTSGMLAADSGFDDGKTVRDAAADVLSRLRLEIPVQRFVAATERSTVVVIAKGFEAKGNHCAPNRSRYRLAAFLRADVAAGGLRTAAAI